MLMIMETQNPYGFILDTDHNRKQKLFNKNGSPKTKILFFGIIILLLLGAYLIISNVFLSKGDAALALINVRAQQEEIIRTATIATEDATSGITKNFALTVLTSVGSDNQSVREILSKANIKVKPIQLAAREDEDLESNLESAKKSGKFDETVTAKLKEQLTVYGTDLSDAYNLVSTDANKLILKSAYDSVTTILK